MIAGAGEVDAGSGASRERRSLPPLPLKRRPSAPLWGACGSGGGAPGPRAAAPAAATPQGAVGFASARPSVFWDTLSRQVNFWIQARFLEVFLDRVAKPSALKWLLALR